MPVSLHQAQALLLVIDLQEKLLPHIHQRDHLLARARLMLQAAAHLRLPLLLSEQYKKGLGETVPEILECLPAATPALEKRAFGCFGDPALAAAIQATGRRQLILVGIETHVCVLQTALAALSEGYDVFLPHDALGSRRPHDHAAGLSRMQQAGAIPASVEMLIMEALGMAGGDAFKAILPLLKS